MWLRHLPSDSALAARGMAGDDRWGMNEQLLAVIADYNLIQDFHFLKAHGGNPDKPQFVERPKLQW